MTTRRPRPIKTTAEPSSRIRDFLKRLTVAKLTAWIGLLVAVIGLRSLLSAHIRVADQMHLDPHNPLSTVFQIENTGEFALQDVVLACMDVDMHVGNSISSGNWSIVNDKPIPAVLPGGKKEFVCPPLHIGPKGPLVPRRVAMIIKVSYSLWLHFGNGDVRFGYVATRKSDGEWVWLHVGAGELIPQMLLPIDVWREAFGNTTRRLGTMPTC